MWSCLFVCLSVTSAGYVTERLTGAPCWPKGADADYKSRHQWFVSGWRLLISLLLLSHFLPSPFYVSQFSFIIKLFYKNPLNLMHRAGHFTAHESTFRALCELRNGDFLCKLRHMNLFELISCYLSALIYTNINISDELK